MTMNRSSLDGATQVPGMSGMFMCSNSTRMGCAVNLKIYFLIKFKILNNTNTNNKKDKCNDGPRFLYKFNNVNTNHECLYR